MLVKHNLKIIGDFKSFSSVILGDAENMACFTNGVWKGSSSCHACQTKHRVLVKKKYEHVGYCAKGTISLIEISNGIASIYGGVIACNSAVMLVSV